METKKIGNQTINVHNYSTVIIGAGAAGMNCAVHLYEFMSQKGVADAGERIADERLGQADLLQDGHKSGCAG